MIPLLLILLSGVAFGCEKVCKQKYVDDVPVDISCSSNCETVTGYIDMQKKSDLCGDNRLCAINQPVIVYLEGRTYSPEIISTVQLSEEKPTYVVEVTTYGVMGRGRHVVLEDYRVGTMQCSGTREECEDLAEALNEAHRRRVK